MLAPASRAPRRLAASMTAVLVFAGDAVAVAVHLGARAVLEEPRGLLAGVHLRTVDAAIAAEAVLVHGTLHGERRGIRRSRSGGAGTRCRDGGRIRVRGQLRLPVVMPAVEHQAGAHDVVQDAPHPT